MYTPYESGYISQLFQMAYEVKCAYRAMFFFLLILKDQISLLNGALYGSPKVSLWTFAKNVMTGSQLTKNGFPPPKMMFFQKISQKKINFWKRPPQH